MGKRSDFERKERDFYPTPEEAVLPLLPHIENYFQFIEPCAGDGALTMHLMKHKDCWCVLQSDIEPKDGVRKMDAFDIPNNLYTHVDYCITNPPWDRKILHPLIEKLIEIAPTWLLFDADWIHTKQSTQYQKYLKKVVSIGRVKWIPGTKSVGKDNCCWYLFDKNYDKGVIEFHGKV